MFQIVRFRALLGLLFEIDKVGGFTLADQANSEQPRGKPLRFKELIHSDLIILNMISFQLNNNPILKPFNNLGKKNRLRQKYFYIRFRNLVRGDDSLKF